LRRLGGIGKKRRMRRLMIPMAAEDLRVQGKKAWLNATGVSEHFMGCI
jgi:hypothetical protein